MDTLFEQEWVPRGKPGTLVPDEEYFDLKAVEYSGEEWSSSEIRPLRRGAFRRAVVFGSLYELERVRKAPERYLSPWLVVLSPVRLPFPENAVRETHKNIAGHDQKDFSVTAAHVMLKDGELRLYHEADYTVIFAKFTAPINPDRMLVRLLESLRFILAEQIPVGAVRYVFDDREVIRLISFGSAPPPATLQRPIISRTRDEHNLVYTLFTAYFEAFRQSETEDLHPVARHLWNVIEASAVSFDAFILSLGIAVEGLVTLCFPEFGKVTNAYLVELNGAIELVDSAKLSDEVKNRILGSIREMRQPRNSDRVRDFIRCYKLNDALLKSWVKLRNASAHGHHFGPDVDNEIVADRDRVVFLLYAIFYGYIGYNGMVTNYGEVGWPTVSWPGGC